MGELADLLAAGASLGVVVTAAMVSGLRWLAKQIHAAKGAQGGDLVRALAADLRANTPTEDFAPSPVQESPGAEILAALGYVVERCVGRAIGPLDRRVARIERRLEKIEPTIAGVTNRQDEHSRRIAGTESAVSAPIELDHAAIGDDP